MSTEHHTRNNELGTIVTRGREASARLDGADLGAEERAQLQAAVAAADVAAAELWELNRGLSVSYARGARQFHRVSSRHDSDDLTQVCDLVLYQAVRSWDPAAGKGLAGWYHLMCRSRVRRAYSAIDGTLTYTPSAYEIASRVAAIVSRHRQDDSPVDYDAVRAELPQMSDAMWRNVLASLDDHPIPLDNTTTFSDEDNRPLHETIRDPNDADPADEAAATLDDFADDDDTRRLLLEALYDLPEPWRSVAIRRSGIHDGESRLFHEIGELHGFSRERARNMWTEALEHLRGHIDLHQKVGR